MKQISDATRENCLRSSGKYTGVPVRGTLFVHIMLPIDVERGDIFDTVLDPMVRIRNKTDRNKVVVKNTIQLNQFETSNDRVDDTLTEFNEDERDDNFPSFGGSSHGGVFFKSRHRSSMNNTLDECSSNRTRYYREALSIF